MALLRWELSRLFVFFCIFHCYSASYFIAAPNLLRVGVEETVSISLFNTDKQVEIKVFLQDYPHRTKTFSQVEGKLTALLPGKFKIKINPHDLPNQKSLGKQYVYLKASSTTPGFQFNDEIKILVSFRNAVVLVQTDKPIYKPGEIVKFRVIPLEVNLKQSLKEVTVELLNPQGIRVDRWRNMNTMFGYFSQEKELPENALLGNWTVIAFYGHGLVQNTSVKFEVRKYVLPKFSVEIRGPDCIYENDTIIEINVKSKYTYGKGVQGSAYIELGVLDDGGKIEKFRRLIHQLDNGEATLFTSTDTIKNHAKNLWFPDGKRLSIEVKVIEGATGRSETVIDNSIFFTKSPLKISFKRTVGFFKPGLPFSIKVDVSYIDGKPAKRTEVTLDAVTDTGNILFVGAGERFITSRTDQLGHADFIINIPNDDGVNYLVVKTTAKVQKAGVDITAENVLRPIKYQSQGKNYLSVKIPKSRVGDLINIQAYILTTGSPSPLTYMVIARGKIIKQGKISKLYGSSNFPTISMAVSSEMSPNARFIAYYIVNNEIVVDSTTMEVQDSFPNQINIKVRNANGLPYNTPGTNYYIDVDTTPYSNVGLMAVDQSVYLLRNDKQLTQDSVLRKLKSHDLGCAVGGGLSNKDVLSRAGLAVMTDVNNLKTDTRTDQECSTVSKRRRRSTYSSEQSQCCQQGEVVDPRSCLVRGQEFDKTTKVSFDRRESCVIKFYICCKKMFETNGRTRSSGGNSNIPDNLFDGYQQPQKDTIEDAKTRINFKETFLYEDYVAGKDGKLQMGFTLPDTITTWVIQAISVSNQTGFGLAAPLHLTAFQPFFVSLSMPYSAQRGEQVSLIATVFNYHNKDLAVWLYLKAPDNNEFCSYVEPGATDTIHQMIVKPNSAESVSFPIVPTVLGDIPIRVTASGNFKNDIFGETDSVERMLKVVPEGMERLQSYSVLLDPLDLLRDPNAIKPVNTKNSSKIISARGHSMQINEVKLELPKSVVAGSASAYVSVMGNLIGEAVSDVIEGRGLHKIIRLPMHCGEQTMLSLAPNVFVLQYLRSTKQVTPKIEETAYKFIRSGYERELTFRRADKSFSAFGNERNGSTWLTAFVIKTFCAIQKLGGVEIDEKVICSAISWLSSIQRPDGAIPERKPVVHQEMNGDINGEIAMTAYVVTALLECKCKTQDSLQTARKAVVFLENNRNQIGRVYVKAVVAYALALASSPHKQAANSELLQSAHYDADKNIRYWTDGDNAINVETTSYALLTQLVLRRTSYCGPIVVWLTEQRKGGGGFVSTQDTCVALQALSMYSQITSGNALNLAVSITTTKFSNYKKTFLIDKQNALKKQQLDISSLIDGNVIIETKGSGVAQLQIETRYNTPAYERELCQFNLTVNTIENVKSYFFDPPSVHKRKKGAKKGKGGKNKGGRRRKKGGRRGKKGRRRGKKGGRGGKKINRGGKKGGGGGPINGPKRITREVKPPNLITVKICTSYKKLGQKTGMSILDVGILTGFSVIHDDVMKLKKDPKLGIAKIEISDRHVIFYLDQIPSNEQLCFTLDMKKGFKVGLLQSVPVIVYDYYEPDNKCTKYYGPKPTSQLNLASCEKEYCKCSHDKCTSPRPSDNVATVINKMCNNFDFAFIAQVLSIDESDDRWLDIAVDVVNVFNISRNKLVHKADRLILLKKAKCQGPEIAQLDSYFLIMGTNAGLRDSILTLDYRVYAREFPKKGRFSRNFKNAVKNVRC